MTKLKIRALTTESRNFPEPTLHTPVTRDTTPDAMIEELKAHYDAGDYPQVPLSAWHDLKEILRLEQSAIADRAENGSATLYVGIK